MHRGADLDLHTKKNLVGFHQAAWQGSNYSQTYPSTQLCDALLPQMHQGHFLTKLNHVYVDCLYAATQYDTSNLQYAGKVTESDQRRFGSEA